MFVVHKILSHNTTVWKTIGLVLVSAWAITWANASWLLSRHGTLQREAANANDCLGYGYGATLPDRCVEAMNAPGVTPDGFYLWVGGALVFGFTGVLFMLGDAFLKRYVDINNGTVG